MIRGVGIKSLEKKEKETVALLTYVQAPNKNSAPVIHHPDVIQELRTLMEFPENLSDLETVNFFAALAIQFARTEVSWFDFLAPRSAEAYFLSVCLDDSDSDLSDYSNSEEEGDDMEDD